MENKEKKKVGRPGKKVRVSQQTPEQKKKRSGGQPEESFGVHVISDEDIEDHFGTSQGGSDGE